MELVRVVKNAHTGIVRKIEHPALVNNMHASNVKELLGLSFFTIIEKY